MGFSTYLGLLAIGLLVVVLSKLNALRLDIEALREELGRRRE
jgi:hypothetical protein